jgi:hypothetical protein
MNSFNQTFQGIGFALQLTWGAPHLPVQIDGPLGHLATVPFDHLEGTGVLLTTMWGPVNVRLDRSNETAGFFITNNEVPLVASPVGQVNPMAMAAEPATSSNGKTIAIVVGSVVAVVGVLAIMMIASVVTTKDKIGRTLNQVSATIGYVTPHTPTATHPQSNR